MSELPGINAKSFDHVTLNCADLEQTRRFYADFLGMIQVPRPAFKFPGMWFQLGNMQIHATQASPESGKAGWPKAEKSPHAGTTSLSPSTTSQTR